MGRLKQVLFRIYRHLNIEVVIKISVYQDLVYSLTDKEFANLFITALCLEGLYGKYFLTLFVACDKACTELYLCLFMFGVYC